MHRIWTDPEIRRFLWDDQIITREQAEAVLRASLDSFAVERFGIWAVSIKPSREIVGFCGMRRTEDSGEVELLYSVLPGLMGQGIASEAAASILRYGLEEIGLESITARTDAPNIASVRVMQKAGMRLRRRFSLNARDTIEYVIAKA